MNLDAPKPTPPAAANAGQNKTGRPFNGAKIELCDTILTDNEPAGKVAIKLSSRGLYTWTIEVPLLRTGTADAQAVNRLAKLDRLLRDTFVDFPKKAGGRFKEIDFLK